MVFTWLPAHVPPHLNLLSWSPLSPASLPTCSWLTGWRVSNHIHSSLRDNATSTQSSPGQKEGTTTSIQSTPGQKEGTATSTQSSPGQKEGTAAPEELTAQPPHPYSCSDFPADSRQAHQHSSLRNTNFREQGWWCGLAKIHVTLQCCGISHGGL